MFEKACNKEHAVTKMQYIQQLIEVENNLATWNRQTIVSAALGFSLIVFNRQIHRSIGMEGHTYISLYIHLIRVIVFIFLTTSLYNCTLSTINYKNRVEYIKAHAHTDLTFKDTFYYSSILLCVTMYTLMICVLFMTIHSCIKDNCMLI